MLWQLYCGLLANFRGHKSDSGPIAARIIDGTLNNAKLKNSHKISRIINIFGWVYMDRENSKADDFSRPM